MEITQSEALTTQLKEWIETIKYPETMPLPESQETRWARLEIPFGKDQEAKLFSTKGEYEALDLHEGIVELEALASQKFPLVSPTGRKLDLKKVEGCSDHCLTLDGKDLERGFEEYYYRVKDLIILYTFKHEADVKAYYFQLTDLDKADFCLSHCQCSSIKFKNLKLLYVEKDTGKVWFFKNNCLMCDDKEVVNFGPDFDSMDLIRLHLYKDYAIVVTDELNGSTFIVDLQLKKWYRSGLYLCELGTFHGLISIPQMGKLFIRRYSGAWFEFWLIKEGSVSEVVKIFPSEIEQDHRNKPSLNFKKDYTIVFESSVWDYTDSSIEALNLYKPDLHFERKDVRQPEIKEDLTKRLTDWIGSITWPAEIPLRESYETRHARLEIPFGNHPVATIHSTHAHFQAVNIEQSLTYKDDYGNFNIYGNYAVVNGVTKDKPNFVIDLQRKKVVASDKENLQKDFWRGLLNIPGIGTVFYCKPWSELEHHFYLFEDGASSGLVKLVLPSSMSLSFNCAPSLSFRPDYTIVVTTQVQTPQEKESDEESYMNYWNR